MELLKILASRVMDQKVNSGFTDDQFDFILENTGTLDELFKKVDRIVNKLN